VKQLNIKSYQAANQMLAYLSIKTMFATACLTLHVKVIPDIIITDLLLRLALISYIINLMEAI
jgi:hypothetical protein